MTLDLGLMLAAMLAIGFAAQWLAWRVRLPAILFLLLAGLLLGPATGVLDPNTMFGDLLFPIVSLSVAVILFEGSLNLRFADLVGIGHAVRRLTTYGALLALLGLALAAHLIAHLSWPLAFLFGALTCVTGPTVVQPLLRTVRPNQRITTLLRWEGIIIDPLGALLAVLVYEAIVSHEQGHSLGVFGLTVGCGALIGIASALLLALALRRQWIPEFLQNYATLALVLVAFALSDAITNQSGLVAVTVMGIALGNMRDVHLDEILDFKENLSTLLVSMLFILLAARLHWPLPPGVLGAALLIFVVAQLLVRPLSSGLALLRSSLNWRERALVAWIAPRGIVAAAVSALFALKLQSLGMPGAEALVPLVFVLIIATVIVQSASARMLARLLRVAAPEPDGVLIFGSDRVARTLAGALQAQDVQVLVADDDWNGIRNARMAGLPTYYGNPTSQHADLHLDHSGLGQLLAMSTRREMNSLACMHYRQEFGRDRVYRLRNLDPNATDHGRASLTGTLLSPALFDADLTHAQLLQRIDRGWRVKSTALTEAFGWPQFLERHGAALLLFARTEKGALRIASTRRELEPRSGWTVTALVPPQPGQDQAARAA
ncbi:MAG TPA: sodium:proton antiporter [Rhodanobacteraceae bacterium]|nr:sodium:proton antiporter [Rhodanobacteraceae bacterium]